MAYIESFLYYLVVLVFVFFVLYGLLFFIIWFYRQLKLFFTTNNEGSFSFKEQKIIIKDILKNKLMLFFMVAYFTTFTVFYINQSIDYYGKNRAYPQAKAYAIVADKVFFWQNVMVNIRLNRGVWKLLETSAT